MTIQDQVKLEPRDQQPSPYLFGGNNYRITQSTPSPTPSVPNAVSPLPIFMGHTPPSPYHANNNVTQNGNGNNQIESILQNQLQAPRSNVNVFQPQVTQQSQYTPNIPPVTPYTVSNSTMWTSNNLNGTCAPSTSRVYNTNMSTIFTQQPINPVQNFNIPNNNNNCEPNKSNFSSLLDLDSQQLLSEQILNISGEMQNLSFGDCVMESFNKHDK